MALHDLLQSIVHEADEQIAIAKKQHADRLKTMSAAHASALQQFRSTTEQRTQQKKRSLREKAESLGRINKAHTVLQHKNAALDALFASVLQKLVSLPAKDLTSFFRLCFDRIGTAQGVLHAAPQHEELLRSMVTASVTIGSPLPRSSGGFILTSPQREWNFTFDFLVHQLLRPMTEISSASRLFTA